MKVNMKAAFRRFQAYYNKQKFLLIKDISIYKNTHIKETKIKSLMLLSQSVCSLYEQSSNLSQNVNLKFIAPAINLKAFVLYLERLQKTSLKGFDTIGERNELSERLVHTFAFFIDEEGVILDIPGYLQRMNKALQKLCQYFTEYHLEEGNTHASNCKTFYLQLEIIYTFLYRLGFVLIDRKIP